MRGGSYLVTRRIRMLIEVWDRATLARPGATIGRNKISGAPLGGAQEFDTVDLAARATTARRSIPIDAHIRLAAPSENDGERASCAAATRSPTAWTSGSGSSTPGCSSSASSATREAVHPDCSGGSARNDALNEYIAHTGSAVFAVPPGTRKGGFVGEALLA